MNIRKNIISITLIMIGIILPIKEKYEYNLYKIKEKKQITNFLNNKNSDNYLLILEIPKISLKKGIYPLYSKKNNIDKEILILPNSKVNKNIYLASHSGTNNNAFFNKIKYLEQGDTIYIYLNNKKYIYEVFNKYYIEKVGYLEVSSNNSKTLTLITCSTKYQNKQLIVLSKLREIQS